MKNFYFSALIFCGLLSAAQTNGQPLPPGEVVNYTKGSGFQLCATMTPSNDIVSIRWRAFNESSTSSYVLEESHDGIAFTPLHEVDAIGDSTGDYTYNDGDSYPADVNFYRLKIVEKDGSAYYSEVVRMDAAAKNIPHLNPTVVHMGANMYIDKVPTQPITIDFFDRSGKRMASYLANGTSFNINTSGWGQGIYFYRMSDPNHPLITSGKILVL